MNTRGRNARLRGRIPVNGAPASRSGAPPDGYTLLVCGVPNTVNMTLFKNLPYDVERDFAPVMRISTAPNILVAYPSLPARSVKELIAIAKARPGQLTYASAGYGSSNHLSGELFRMMAGVNIVHVPYKGGGAARRRGTACARLLARRRPSLRSSIPT